MAALSLGLALGLNRNKGGGAAPFSLNDVSGRIGWWSSRDLAAIQGMEEHVAQLDDKTGLGVPVVQSGADKQPMLLEGCVRFQSADDVLSTTANYSVTGATARHVFAVLRRNNGGDPGPVCHWGTQTTRGAFGLVVNAAGSGLTGYVWGTGDLSFGAVTTAKQLAYFGNDGTTSFGAQNGAQTFASTAVVPATGAGPLSLGRRPTGVIDGTDLDLFDLFVVTGPLSLALYNQITGALAWDNSIVASLASDHPYKNARP